MAIGAGGSDPGTIQSSIFMGMPNTSHSGKKLRIGASAVNSQVFIVGQPKMWPMRRVSSRPSQGRNKTVGKQPTPLQGDHVPAITSGPWKCSSGWIYDGARAK